MKKEKYYVIGLVEKGERMLSCKNQEYTIKKGHLQSKKTAGTRGSPH